ncbi:MAG: CRTAC1 family protein, partial [Bacteroidetes bacterium]|nr:CRTAC1 family protein [Bacteroidota bacterium]
MYRNYILILFMIGTLVVIGCGGNGEPSQLPDQLAEGENEDQSVKQKLFELISPDESGVRFINTIIEDAQNNYYQDHYYYNGAGVAIGDINNDGYADICFTGNRIPNRLYLNKGNMKFEDITSIAGLSMTLGWSTGVTMVDINADGFLDIYICRGGTKEKEADQRKNLLYINNGDFTFTEKAADYGLDDSRWSVQAAFFDYDKDGDLDVYIANRPFEFRKMVKISQVVTIREYDEQLTDKLYRNNGNETFTDVSKQAGIVNNGSGLGLAIGDLNQDGWPDIYVANDFMEPDYYYVNNGDGTFTESLKNSFRHVSNFGMGSDLADINNDGLLDIVVADMTAEDNYRQKTSMDNMNSEKFWAYINAGFHHQYMRNTLQLNNGNGSFSEIGQMAGIQYTDWSWAPLLADFDNDGLKDLMVTNGILRDIKDKDFINKSNTLASQSGWKLKYEEVDALLKQTTTSSYIYKNNGDLTFKKMNEEWGFDLPTFANGAAYGDLDNDGDLDIVISNINSPASILRNKAEEVVPENKYLTLRLNGNTKNIFGLGTKIEVQIGDVTQLQEVYSTRGYQSACDNVIHFGLGSASMIDEIRIKWPNGKMERIHNQKANAMLSVDQVNATETWEPKPDDNQTLFSEAPGRAGISFK